MAPKFNKLHVTHCVLKEHPAYRRYDCYANAILISEAIPGKNEWFFASDQEEYLPVKMVEEAIARVKHQLADAFRAPVDRWLASRSDTYSQCEANKRVLLTALENEGATSTDDLAEMLTAFVHPGHPSSLDGSLLLSEQFQVERGREEQRTSLAEKIIKSEKKKQRPEWEQRVRNASLEELRIIRDEQTLRQSTKDEVRATLVAEDRRRQSELVDRQFTKWPGQYIPPGKPPECGVPLTVYLFKQLPAPEIARLFRVFGKTQLDRALAETQVAATQKGNS